MRTTIAVRGAGSYRFLQLRFSAQPNPKAMRTVSPRLSRGIIGDIAQKPGDPCSTLVFEMMLDLLPFREVDRIFADVCREISNTLQISAH